MDYRPLTSSCFHTVLDSGLRVSYYAYPGCARDGLFYYDEEEGYVSGYWLNTEY